MAYHIIINPASAGGKTGLREPGIRALASHYLPDCIVHKTERAGWAGDLLRELELGEADAVLVVGGDGTINEVINGLMKHGDGAGSRPVLGLIPSGSGGDFRRTFAIPLEVEKAFQRIVDNQPQTIDLGQVVAGDGTERIFANISSVGLSAEIGLNTNKANWLKKINGTLAFNWTIVRTALQHRRFALKVKTPEAPGGKLWDANCVAVCNGQYFGSGVRVARDADPGDGFFDVTVVHGLSPLGFLKGVAQIKKNDAIMPRGMSKLRVAWIEISPEEVNREVFIETDGEFAGTLPARFSVIPAAIRLF